MMSRDDGSRKIGGRTIGEGPYDGGSRQATLAERRVSLTVEFKIAFREITPETALEMNPSDDPEEVLGDAALMGEVERQAKILGALLEDEEALRGFIACAVIDEVAAGDGELLRKALGARSDEEVLRPVTERMGAEDAEFYEGAREEGVFDERLDLLLYSTPVECLGVRMTEVSEDDGAAESDPLR